MWIFLIVYLIGCVIAYIFIGYVNDTEVSSAPDIAFAYVFLSWMMLGLMLIFKIQEMSPPTLKRKRKIE